jgi:hypothetical protein
MARILDKINNVAFATEKRQREKKGKTTIKGIYPTVWHFTFFCLLFDIRPSSSSDQYTNDMSVIWKA